MYLAALHPVGLAIVVGVAVLIAAWWLCWRLPKRQADRLSLSDAKARADVEDNFRRTIGQLLGGAAVLTVILVGAWFAFLQFLEFAERQTASQELLKRNQELLIRDQATKGFEQLGSDKDVVRLGGIYLLETIVGDLGQHEESPGQQQIDEPILYALCAFVRERTKAQIVGGQRPAADVQAALTVIGKNIFRPILIKLDLDGAHIPNARLYRAQLSSANLIQADLSNADLHSAELNNAALTGANLSGANLTLAGLLGADLAGANLSGANLSRASLQDANLSGANLSKANFSGAELGVRPDGLGDPTNLSKADLSDATISQNQLDKACGEDAKLPPGLSLKPCASPSPPPGITPPAAGPGTEPHTDRSNSAPASVGSSDESNSFASMP